MPQNVMITSRTCEPRCPCVGEGPATEAKYVFVHEPDKPPKYELGHILESGLEPSYGGSYASEVHMQNSDKTIRKEIQ